MAELLQVFDFEGSRSAHHAPMAMASLVCRGDVCGVLGLGKPTQAAWLELDEDEKSSMSRRPSY